MMVFLAKKDISQQRVREKNKKTKCQINEFILTSSYLFSHLCPDVKALAALVQTKTGNNGVSLILSKTGRLVSQCEAFFPYGGQTGAAGMGLELRSHKHVCGTWQRCGYF